MRPDLAAAKTFVRGVAALSSAVDRVRLARTRKQMFAAMVAQNPVLAAPASPAYLREIDRYWTHHYGRSVDPRWHVACANVTGVEDVRYVPHFVWWDEVLGMLNDRVLRASYGDKNLYRLLIRDDAVPATVVKRMHGGYYDADHRPVPRASVVGRIAADGLDKVIKPSRSDNGEGVRRIAVAAGRVAVEGVEMGIDALEREYGADFLVQAAIVQHPALAEPHPASANTLRLLTLRWRGEIGLLVAFARFGTAGRATDNAGTGGVCCGIDDDGRLHDAAVDKVGRRYQVHPTSGYDFGARRSVPGFAAAARRAIELHRQLPHFDLASWDIAISPQATPIFVEVNFRGTSFLYQFACRRPIFGDRTPELLAALRRNRG